MRRPWWNTRSTWHHLLAGAPSTCKTTRPVAPPTGWSSKPAPWKKLIVVKFLRSQFFLRSKTGSSKTNSTFHQKKLLSDSRSERSKLDSSKIFEKWNWFAIEEKITEKFDDDLNLNVSRKNKIGRLLFKEILVFISSLCKGCGTVAEWCELLNHV